METERVSASTTIEAAPEAVFAVLADPSTHADIDGTGWVRGSWTAIASPPPARSRTTVTLMYDWSAVPSEVREYLRFPAFGQDHLDNSLQHLSDLVG
jgi:hypothetical protein